MAETKQQETRLTETTTAASATPAASSTEPALTIKRGKTTFLIAVHFNENAKETMDDIIKRLIQKDVERKDF